MSNKTISAWDPSCKNFACVSAENKIRVFNTSTNRHIELVLPFHIPATYTCLAWSPASGPANSKKRAREATFSHIVTGTETGKIIVWNVENKEVVKELDTETNAPVVSVSFTNASTVIATIEPNIVQRWLFVNGILLSKTTLGKTVSAVTGNDSIYAVGTTGSTMIYDNTSEKLKHTLQGHSSDTTLIEVSANFIVTASRDRFVNVYLMSTLTEDAQTPVSPHLVLTLHNPPAAISINDYKDYADISVTTEDGSINLCRVTKKVSKSAKPSTVLKLDTDKSELRIISSKFNSQSGLLIAIGNAAKTVFQSFTYQAEKKIVPSTLIQIPSDINSTTDVHEITEAAENAEHNKKAVARGLANMETADARFKVQVYDDAASKYQPASAEVLSARVKDLHVPEKTVAQSSAGANFSIALDQALKIGDKNLLQDCLAQTDLDLIQSSVRSLPANRLSALIDAIVSNFGNSISIASCTLWIRALLSVQSNSLLNRPDLLMKISPLYHLISARLSTFSSLLDLSGRLDLVLSLGNVPEYESVTLTETGFDVPAPKSRPTPKSKAKAVANDAPMTDENIDDLMLDGGMDDSIDFGVPMDPKKAGNVVHQVKPFDPLQRIEDNDSDEQSDDNEEDEESDGSDFDDMEASMNDESFEDFDEDDDDNEEDEDDESNAIHALDASVAADMSDSDDADLDSSNVFVMDDIRTPAKTPAKASAKTPVKTPAKTSVKTPAKESVKTPAKASAVPSDAVMTEEAQQPAPQTPAKTQPPQTPAKSAKKKQTQEAVQTEAPETVTQTPAKAQPATPAPTPKSSKKQKQAQEAVMQTPVKSQLSAPATPAPKSAKKQKQAAQTEAAEAPLPQTPAKSTQSSAPAPTPKSSKKQSQPQAPATPAAKQPPQEPVTPAASTNTPAKTPAKSAKKAKQAAAEADVAATEVQVQVTPVKTPAKAKTAQEQVVQTPAKTLSKAPKTPKGKTPAKTPKH